MSNAVNLFFGRSLQQKNRNVLQAFSSHAKVSSVRKSNFSLGVYFVLWLRCRVEWLFFSTIETLVGQSFRATGKRGASLWKMMGSGKGQELDYKMISDFQEILCQVQIPHKYTVCNQYGAQQRRCSGKENSGIMCCLCFEGIGHNNVLVQAIVLE